MANNIFKAREIDSNRTGWVCDLSGPDAVNPDAYFFFNTKAKAETFNRLVARGMSTSEALYRQEAAATMGRHKSDIKATAARQNGQKGGRPRKTQTPE